MRHTERPCYVCQQRNNPIIASEPVEHRFGMPLMPEGRYDFARCRACSTLYVDSDVTDAYLTRIYENESLEDPGTEVSRLSHEEVLELRGPEFERHWQILRRIRPPRHGAQLLDVGCQMGDFGVIAMRDGVQPNGLELSAPYVDVCRQRWGADAIVHCGTFDSADFHGRQFDYVTAFETLEHVCDPASILRQMRAVLAPGGLLALSVPSSDYFHFKYWSLVRSPFSRALRAVMTKYRPFYSGQVLPHTHIYSFSHRSVALLLEKAGLTPAHISLTGWHGPTAPLFGAAGWALERASVSRIGFAPSLFAVATAKS